MAALALFATVLSGAVAASVVIATIRAYIRNSRTRLLWLVPFSIGFSLATASNAVLTYRLWGGNQTHNFGPLGVIGLIGASFLLLGFRNLAKYRDPTRWN